MRRAAKRDANEGELVALAIMLGCQIVKAPPLDLWVWAPKLAAWRPVEVKAKKGKYTLAQEKFFFDCSLNGSPYWTWRTPDDVLATCRERKS